MKTRKITMIILASLLGFSLLFSGCNAKTEEETATTAPTKEQATAESTQQAQEPAEGEREKEGIMYLEGLPIVDEEDAPTITIGIRHAPDQCDFNTEGPLALMKQDSNVDIQFVDIPSSGGDEKAALMLATGDYPDAFIRVTMLRNSAATWKYASEGIFVPLTEYIDKYCPTLQALFEQYPLSLKQATAPDGNIYSLPCICDNGLRDIRGTLFVNQVWLDNLDLDAPVTTEDYVDMLVAFRDNDANGNGDPDDETPFECNGYTICNSYGDLMGSFGVLNADKDNPYVIIDGKVTYEVVTEKYKEALKYIRRLWEEDLMGIETYTQDWDTYLSKFQNADGDIMVGSMCGYLSWDAIDQDLALETYTCIEPLVGPDGTQYWRYYPKGAEDAHLFHMTDKCEYPEVLMRVMDTWNTEYYAYSAMRGVEGVHWEYTDDGHIKKINYTTDELAADPFLNAGLTTSWKGPWSVTIDTFSKEIELSVQDADRLERCNMYKPFLQDISTVYPAFTFVNDEDNETLSIIENDIKAYVQRMEADFVMNGNIDERWDEFVAEIEKMGLSEALAIRQAAID